MRAGRDALGRWAASEEREPTPSARWSDERSIASLLGHLNALGTPLSACAPQRLARVRAGADGRVMTRHFRIVATALGCFSASGAPSDAVV
jgi:hypothetical protein